MKSYREFIEAKRDIIDPKNPFYKARADIEDKLSSSPEDDDYDPEEQERLRKLADDLYDLEDEKDDDLPIGRFSGRGKKGDEVPTGFRHGKLLADKDYIVKAYSKIDEIIKLFESFIGMRIFEKSRYIIARQYIPNKRYDSVAKGLNYLNSLAEEIKENKNKFIYVSHSKKWLYEKIESDDFYKNITDVFGSSVGAKIQKDMIKDLTGGWGEI